MDLAPTLKLYNGQEIPLIGLGTYASDRGKKGTCRNAVIYGIRHGYRHIDTASFYQNEEEVGEAIETCIKEGIVKREDLFVVTKLWNDDHRKDQVLPAINKSLKKLKLKFVDLFLVHWPISQDASGKDAKIDLMETWKAMEEVQNLGLTKSIGMSNFNEAQIDRICAEGSIKPTVNQFEVNPGLSCVNLVKHCQSKGIAVTAYCPLGSLPDAKKGRVKEALDEHNATLQKLSTKYGKTTAQIVLRFLIDRELVVIPKSFTESRISENANIFDFKLTEEEVQDILKLDSGDRCVAIDFWKSYLNYPF